MAPRNIHTLGSSGSRPSSSSSSRTANPTFRTIWDSIPPVTRAIALLLCIVNSLYLLQLVNFGYFIFQWNETFRYFQFWRLVTSCMILPAQAMPALFEVYQIFTRSSQLENEHFFITSIANPSIDYAFYICFCILLIVNATAYVYGVAASLVLTSAFTSCLTFTWAVDNANTKILFQGFIPVYGKYFPLIQLATSFIFNDGNVLISLIGTFAGYIYLCLDTRTLGPVWGFITRKHPSYGRAPGGKFCAPRWFIFVYETIFRIAPSQRHATTIVSPSSGGLFSSVFKGSGERLGGESSTRNSDTTPTPRGGPSGSNDSTSAQSSGVSTATTGNFRGTGQRLGGNGN